jgi:hypothetical protein
MEIPIFFNAEKFINILIQRKEEVGETQIPEIDAKRLFSFKYTLSKIFFICSVYSRLSLPRISSCASASSTVTSFTSITRRASLFISTFMESIIYPTDPTATLPFCRYEELLKKMHMMVNTITSKLLVERAHSIELQTMEMAMMRSRAILKYLNTSWRHHLDKKSHSHETYH